MNNDENENEIVDGGFACFGSCKLVNSFLCARRRLLCKNRTNVFGFFGSNSLLMDLRLHCVVSSHAITTRKRPDGGEEFASFLSVRRSV
jgi:hypothetical protein